MSSDDAVNKIQADLSAKKSRLEALRANRLQRQKSMQMEMAKEEKEEAEREQQEAVLNASKQSILSPTRQSSGGAAAALNDSLASVNYSDLHDSASDAALLSRNNSNLPSLNVSLQHVPSDLQGTTSGADVTLAAGGNITSPLSSVTSPTQSAPSTMTRRFSRISTGGKSSNEQMQLIKQSLEEIAQHSSATSALDSSRHSAHFRARSSLTPSDSPNLTASSPSPAALNISNFASPKSTIAPVSEEGGADDENGRLPPPSFPVSPIPSSLSPKSAAAASSNGGESQQAMIDDLLAQIQSLSEEVRSKNEDLQVAGECGSVLLAHNEEANKKIEELQQLVEQQSNDIYVLKDESRTAERKSKKLSNHLTELQQLQSELESELEIVKMELELEKNNSRALEVDLNKLQKSQQEAVAIRELQEELKAMTANRDKLEQQVNEARKTREETNENYKILKEEYEILQENYKAAEKYEAQAAALQAELVKLKAQDTVNVLAELVNENQRLDSNLHELTVQYETLLENNQRDQALLRSLQSKNEALERELHEARIGSQRSPKAFESLADDEVLDDGSAALAEAARVEAEIAAKNAAIAAREAKDAQDKLEAERKAEEQRHTEEQMRHATSAAAMHVGAKLSGNTPAAHLSSLASGSASLAFSAAATTAGISPIKPAGLATSSTGGAMTAGSSSSMPSAAAAAVTLSPSASSAMNVGSKSTTGGGVLGFISSFLPGSAANKLSFEKTNAHPLSGGGGLAFLNKNSNRKGSDAGEQYDANGERLTHLAGDGDNKSPSPGSTVWDESELDHHDVASRNSSHASSFTGRKPGVRDADFEFFALTLLCVKIHSARKMESLYMLSTQSLWEKCKREEIAFHQYYSWLENEITKAYVAHLYREAEKDANSIDNSATPAKSLNTAAARMQLQTPIANSPNLSPSSAAGEAGAAAAVRILQRSASPPQQSSDSGSASPSSAGSSSVVATLSDEFNEVALTEFKPNESQNEAAEMIRNI